MRDPQNGEWGHAGWVGCRRMGQKKWDQFPTEREGGRGEKIFLRRRVGHVMHSLLLGEGRRGGGWIILKSSVLQQHCCP